MKVIFGKNIIADSQILAGKPVIRGTRIPVDLILKKLAENIPADEILRDYPRLTKDHIQEILKYAHSLVSREEVYPASL
ncbi:MAG: Protein containing DUF433 [Candidatus Curtissbacteria bacterium GW2011_GWA1_41_11]|uniref:Protein containing DUF433 n=1 Tax=Candidatus Curtissbacteria bacterium GW2011_GWA1_41_11 TaxID=1618409 RepID=A0A0G0UGR7_9BACT|nr:MAG: Protein containing DUF433 [Candidatus Curtissbacteria bacterium GW2011_GWA1_41_11]